MPHRLAALTRGAPLRVWSLAALLALAVFSLTRAALLVHAGWQLEQEAAALWPAFFLGLLRDLPVAAAVASPFLAWELCLPDRWQDHDKARRLRLALFDLYLFTLLFTAVSEGIFWGEFAARFNFIALDYLVFTTEVIGNIRESYPVGPIVAALAALTAGSLWLLRRPLAWATGTPQPRRLSWLAALPLALLAWSTFLALPPPEFARNSFSNELADNGWRSFVWAARQNRLDYRQFYAQAPDGEVARRLAKLTHPGPAAAHPLVKPGVRPHVVIVTMESLSAEFMGTFGNDKGLTPNLDRLAGEGLLFTRLFAAGTRTVRGLEALSAALPPLPGKSLVRWPERGDLDTLGHVLGQQGWSPYFIYGGYGMFDNMNDYFAQSGYQVRDRTDFPADPKVFANIWGVADEHLFDQVIATLDQESAQGRPVFAQVMTTSNHVPFTYPDGRIDMPSPGGREGAIKYADYAIGRFIETARQKPWFDNTLFLFVADHCARSAGKSRIPVYRYHIPAIAYAPALIAPRQVDTLSSQIDLAPTLLAMLGIERDSPFLGRDILSMAPEEGRALLSTYQNLGYLKGDILTVLSPKRQVEAFQVSEDRDEARPVPVSPTLKAEAIAYFQGAAMLMERHLGTLH